MKIVVIGAGVIGLTTAYSLKEAGHDVNIIAESFSPKTVSDVAAAVWKPYSSEESNRAGLWSKVTLNILRKHANNPEAGITPLWVNQVGQKELPWWSEFVPQAITEIYLTKANIEGTEVPSCRYRSVVADMSIYMPWLMKQCENAGIRFTAQSVDNLEDVLKNYDAAVVCTGGNKKLCAEDNLLRPLIGVVLIYPGRLVDECWSRYTSDGPTYINPRTHETVVGGTAILSEQELTPAFLEEAKIAIRRRAQKLVPSLATENNCKVIHADRPFRSTVRLEKTRIGGKPVVYNYGHGGAGVTFSWGCAMEVSILLAENPNLSVRRKQDITLPTITAVHKTTPIHPRISLRAKATLGWLAVRSSPIHPFRAYQAAKSNHLAAYAPPPGLPG